MYIILTRCHAGGQKVKSNRLKEDSTTKLRIRRSERGGGAPRTHSALEIDEGCDRKLRSRKNKVIMWLYGTNVIYIEMILELCCLFFSCSKVCR